MKFHKCVYNFCSGEEGKQEGFSSTKESAKKTQGTKAEWTEFRAADGSGLLINKATKEVKPLDDEEDTEGEGASKSSKQIKRLTYSLNIVKVTLTLVLFLIPTSSL